MTSREQWKTDCGDEGDLAKSFGGNVRLGSCLAKLKNTGWEIHLVNK